MKLWWEFHDQKYWRTLVLHSSMQSHVAKRFAQKWYNRTLGNKNVYRTLGVYFTSLPRAQKWQSRAYKQGCCVVKVHSIWWQLFITLLGLTLGIFLFPFHKAQWWAFAAFSLFVSNATEVVCVWHFLWIIFILCNKAIPSDCTALLLHYLIN